MSFADRVDRWLEDPDAFRCLGCEVNLGPSARRSRLCGACEQKELEHDACKTCGALPPDQDAWCGYGSCDDHCPDCGAIHSRPVKVRTPADAVSDDDIAF